MDSPRRLVQFWQDFQTSLVLLIPNCTRYRMITYTNFQNRRRRVNNIASRWTSGDCGVEIKVNFKFLADVTQQTRKTQKLLDRGGNRTRNLWLQIMTLRGTSAKKNRNVEVLPIFFRYFYLPQSVTVLSSSLPTLAQTVRDVSIMLIIKIWSCLRGIPLTGYFNFLEKFSIAFK
jgi:hypothetical protein